MSLLDHTAHSPSLPSDGLTDYRRGPLPPVPPVLPAYYGAPIDTPPGHRWAGPRATEGLPMLRPSRHPFTPGGTLEGFDPDDTCTQCLLGRLAHDYLDGAA